MKAIVLAAGFATRLYPITKNKIKPLLEIKGKPIIEKINEIIITNNKFYKDFIDWKNKKI